MFRGGRPRVTGVCSSLSVLDVTADICSNIVAEVACIFLGAKANPLGVDRTNSGRTTTVYLPGMS